AMERCTRPPRRPGDGPSRHDRRTRSEGAGVKGRLERHGEGWQLRFERRFDAPIEAVWNALIAPEDLAAWFPQRIVGEWRVGAPLRFEFTDQDVPPFEGIVRVFEPPSSLEYSW